MQKKPKKKVVKKKAVKALNEELLLQLDGNIFVVETRNGKVFSKEPLDGTVVLKCLLNCITDGLYLLEKKKK